MKKVMVLAQPAAGVSGSPLSGLILAQGMTERGWYVVTVFGEDGPSVERYRESGLEVHVIRQHGWLVRRTVWRRMVNMYHNMRATGRILQLLRRVQADVVYVNSMATLPPVLAGRLCRLPVCWHIREQFADDGGEMVAPGLLGRRGVQWTVRQLADRVVTVSKLVMNETIGGCSTEQGRVVQNGVPDEFFREPEPSNERSKLVIGVPGTLRPMKGQEFLLRAIAPVLKEHPHVQLALTGTAQPAYQSLLDRVIEEHQLQGQVSFVGQTDDMAGFLAGCDIAVVPSRADPLPRTVMESMAVGLPVVATRVGGIPEMIDDGTNGLLVEYGNEQAAADSLRELVADPKLRDRLGDAAYRKARSQFTQQRYQDEIQTIVNEVCA